MPLVNLHNPNIMPVVIFRADNNLALNILNFCNVSFAQTNRGFYYVSM